MRTLLLFRGAPGCGKSTFIKNYCLEQFTLSADNIRMLYQSPEQTVDGSIGISQKNDGIVWKTLFQILEHRMKNGDFTVIDATNSKTEEMRRYRTLAKEYRYRIYLIDMTDVPIDVCKRQNRQRMPLKQVPDEVIDRMYARFATQKVPSGIKVITRDDLEEILYYPTVVTGYEKIHHIGDIHGCYSALRQYLNENGGLKDNEFYIFTGDYIDRGLENAEVVKFLISIADKPNVLLLEGNHERWLWNWATDQYIPSQEFVKYTAPQLEAAKISKGKVRQLYRKLVQCTLYEFNGKTVFVNHAGLSYMPSDLLFVPTRQMIHGVGRYQDAKLVDDTFMEKTNGNIYQIHGHRNTADLPIKVNDRCFNLEGGVEFGGSLRCVTLSSDGSFKCTETPNKVFREFKREPKPDTAEIPVGDLVEMMRGNKYIDEKKFGSISSFNFSREAFYEGIWDHQTVRARGLFVDSEKNRIVARSYDKFFAINERPETKLDSLKHRLQFPISCYVKENGFLGMVSYDEAADDLMFASKSSLNGPFVGYLKDMFFAATTAGIRESIRDFIRENNVTFVFECVDMVNDPHVIKYPESGLYLLDIIDNTADFHHMNYETMCKLAGKWGLTPKKKARILESYGELREFFDEAMDPDYTYEGDVIEGFVLEDAAGFMLKMKLDYYRFWKRMRGVAAETFKRGMMTSTSSLATPLANEFYGWARKKYEDAKAAGEPLDMPHDICTLRDMFYTDTAAMKRAE